MKLPNSDCCAIRECTSTTLPRTPRGIKIIDAFQHPQQQALTQSVQRSKKDLKDFLLENEEVQPESTPFTWTKGPENIPVIFI